MKPHKVSLRAKLAPVLYGVPAYGFCRFRKRRHSRGRSHAYTRLRLASGSVARTRALNAPQRRTLSLVFSYAAHPVGEPPMAAYEKRHPKVSFAVVVGGYDEFAINCPNAMRGCDLRRFKCEDEGAYLAYVTEIRDTQKGRKVRPSLRLVVGLNRLELSTSRLSGVCSNQLSYNPLVPLSGGLWWRCTDSNRGPLECKSSALPTELHPRGECLKMIAPA